MTASILCPACGRTEKVEKVSTLYLTGIGLREKNVGAEADKPAAPPRIQASPALSRQLAPPSGKRQGMTRPIHPDLAMLAFSAIMPVFFYGIYTSQNGFFLPALALLLVFYGVYFWLRKRLVARYAEELAARQGDDERVKKGIALWMKLYCCLEDEIVFEPGKGAGVPLDQMAGYLLREG